MKIGILSFSEKGFALAKRLSGFFEDGGDSVNFKRAESGELSPWTKEHFFSDDAIIYISSCGIALRGVAPFVKSKTTDPAVVVIDECGTFAVSLLSGHIGGANALTAKAARFIGAMPVITTASDRNGVFAFDSWASANGLTVANPERIKWVSAKMLAGETVKIKSSFPIEGPLPEGTELAEENYDVLITYRSRGKGDALRLVPKLVSLGIGCKKNISADSIEEAFAAALKKSGCHPAAIKQVCSIDLKAQEPGILAFCKEHGFDFITFSANQLIEVPGSFTSSAFVKSVTGVDNVCERSAVLGSGENGKLISQKDAGNGITMALGIEPYTVRFFNENK